MELGQNSSEKKTSRYPSSEEEMHKILNNLYSPKELEAMGCSRIPPVLKFYYFLAPTSNKGSPKGVLMFENVGGDRWRIIEDCRPCIGERYRDLLNKTIEKYQLVKVMGCNLDFVGERERFVLPYTEHIERGIDLIFECRGKNLWGVSERCKSAVLSYEVYKKPRKPVN